MRNSPGSTVVLYAVRLGIVLLEKGFKCLEVSIAGMASNAFACRTVLITKVSWIFFEVILQIYHDHGLVHAQLVRCALHNSCALEFRSVLGILYLECSANRHVRATIDGGAQGSPSLHFTYSIVRSLRDRVCDIKSDPHYAYKWLSDYQSTSLFLFRLVGEHIYDKMPGKIIGQVSLIFSKI